MDRSANTAWLGRASSRSLAALAAWLYAGVALAQEAADERAASFRAVQGAVKEDVPGGPLLVGAYAVIWVLMLLFVVRLVRQQAQSQRDLERLERLLGTAPAAASAAPSTATAAASEPG